MEAHIRILKFGGTSVGSGERIRRVASIIAHAANDAEEAFPVIVVSAMSGVTDQLLRIARYACTSEHTEEARLAPILNELEALKHRHFEAAEKAVQKQENRNPLQHDLERAFAALEEDIASIGAFSGGCGARIDSFAPLTSIVPVDTSSGEGDVPQGSRGEIYRVPTGLNHYASALAAWGERLSVLLVAAAAHDIGVKASPVCQEVIITDLPPDDIHQRQGTVIGADPLPEETRCNARALIAPLVEQRVVPIVAGFIGRTTSGVVMTLGRNGSDYSATVIGAALDCVEVSIYTDVDGVMTADPRVVMNTRLLPRLSYAEAARLSWFGAKVLHPRTLIPVAHRNIPVRVRNTFRPHLRGTVVGPDGVNGSAGDSAHRRVSSGHDVSSQGQSGAAAISVRRHLALVTVESTDLFGAPENAGQVFALAARAGAAPVAICSSSGHHLAFMVEEQAVESVVTLFEQWQHEQRDLDTWRIRYRGGLAACACIGSGFTVDPMSPARAITALARERIPLITQGASELGITLIVEDADSERALRCLHRDLIAPVIPLVRHGTESRKGAINGMT